MNEPIFFFHLLLQKQPRTCGATPATTSKVFSGFVLFASPFRSASPSLKTLFRTAGDFAYSLPISPSGQVPTFLMAQKWLVSRLPLSHAPSGVRHPSPHAYHPLFSHRTFHVSIGSPNCRESTAHFSFAPLYLSQPETPSLQCFFFVLHPTRPLFCVISAST